MAKPFIISAEEQAFRAAWINHHEGLKRELAGEDGKFPKIDHDEDAAAVDPEEGPWSPYRHAGSLYPAEALEVLAESRDEPEVPIDGTMERLLGSWIASHITDYPAYVQDLFAAINKLKCLPGVYLRLNLACLAQPTMRPQGGISFDGPEIFVGKRRRQVRRFLMEQRLFSPHIQQVYDGLREAHNSYSLEQALLGWMGYLIVKRVVLKAGSAPEAADIQFPLLGFSP
jgi:hypothetical protein